MCGCINENKAKKLMRVFNVIYNPKIEDVCRMHFVTNSKPNIQQHLCLRILKKVTYLKF